jgi:SlyX protein
MNERLIDLEIRLTHQEAAIEALSDEIARQQKTIERLEAQLAALREQLRTQAPGVIPAAEEKPPPHY